MTLVCLEPVSHDGDVYPAGAELPASVDAARLLRLGVVEEHKPKPPAKAKPKAGS